MIRTKTKAYGEINNVNTVLHNTSQGISGFKLPIGKGNKSIGALEYSSSRNGLYIVKGNGEISVLPLLADKLIGTDADGNIVLIDSEDII